MWFPACTATFFVLEVRHRTDASAAHIGLVRKLEYGVLYTIEGNKGGFPAKVNQFDYVLSRMDNLLGFGRVS